MVPEPINLKQQGHSTTEEDSQLINLDRDLMDMASMLSLTDVDIENESTTTQNDEYEEDCGLRIIAIEDSDTGEQEKLDKTSNNTHGMSNDNEVLNVYTNSNFQAINNSIMLNGSFSSRDPGVHMKTTYYVDHSKQRPKKHGKKGKRNVRGSSQSNQESGSGISQGESSNGEA